jgi:diketogulonate reductase-like aldo/keto reductase
MQRLGLEQLDLYLMHFPVPEKRLESWRAMERLYREERVKAIGVSNFLPHHLEQLLATCTVKPMLNQIEAHPFQTQLPTRQYCQANNIVVSAYSPLVKAQQMNHPVLCKIAQEHHKTVAQVLVRWSLQSGMVPLPKSNNPQRIIENSQVYDFSLTSAQMQQLNTLNRDLYTGWSPLGVP